MTRRRAILGFMAGLASVVVLWAHDPGISTVQGQVLPDRIELVAGFAPADARQFLLPVVGTGARMTAAEFEAARAQLAALVPLLWEARVGNTVLPPRESSVQLLPGDNVSLRVVLPRPAGNAPVSLRATQLGRLPPGHRQFVVMVDAAGAPLAKKLLSVADDTIAVPLVATAAAAEAMRPDELGAGALSPPAMAGTPTSWGFVRLGVAHIWTGYDHLLFLFALLVVCRSFKSIVAIVTCFTLAHSTTLALATLDLVNLPSRFTEPAIAATIVFVGAENLWRRGAEPPGRWALTFAFGLIHGFGFASVLRELGVGEGGASVAMPLFTFNAGVEVGQVLIAVVVLPLVWRLRKNEAFVARGVPALSALVALAGVYWFLERTVFA